MSSLVVALLAFLTVREAIPLQQPPDDSGTHAQSILAALAAKDFPSVEAQFTDKMKAALPAGGLEASWTRVIGQAGPFKSCGQTRVQSMANIQVTVTLCEFERAKIDVQIAFDRDGRFAGLLFRPPAAPSVP